MKSKRTREFRELYDALPLRVRQQADKAFAQFRKDHTYPALNFKPVSGMPLWFSARIGINYRAVCIRTEASWVWFWIGSHADYDSLLKQK